MTGWSWRLTPRAERDIKRLDKPVVGRVFDALDKLIASYRQGDVVRLQGISPPAGTGRGAGKDRGSRRAR